MNYRNNLMNVYLDNAATTPVLPEVAQAMVAKRNLLLSNHDEQ
jgi:cysteine sulfinate desulfinase/cysteine desulfurase-like protein